MDTWKGQKLYGADRRMTRAQLEASEYAAPRPRSEQRAVARLARQVSKLHVATGGKGSVWVEAIDRLVRAVIR